MFNRMNPEARIAVMQAIDEARELGHAEVGADHVLLGLLANVRGETYALLTDHGLDFTSARAIVIDQHVEPAGAASADEPPELDEDREALRAIGIDLDKVRDAVKSTFGDDITEGWGERAGRGPRGRGRGRHHHHHHRGEGGPTEEGAPLGEGRRGGRGRRGPRSERFGDRPMFSAELRNAMRATVREARRDAADGDRRGPGGPTLTAAAILAAITTGDDPVVDAILNSATNPHALREAVASYAGQPAA
jgi:Clp amino terminal domain, pathogenicity island component